MAQLPRPTLSRRSFLAAGTATAGLTVLHPFTAKARPGQAHLRLMETTDIHVHIYPYDYYADEPVDTAGLARTASIIADIRAEAANSILLDNGDLLQGNPLGDYIAYERGMTESDTHPMVAAMNAVGIEASTLGNHEFNYGLDFLMTSLADSRFPMVNANVATRMGATPTEDETLLPPYVILDRELTDGAGETHPIRIGLIGFVTPQIMQWDRKHLEGRVDTRDIVETARAWVPKIRAEGVDILIALNHSGIGSAEYREGMENATVPLAAVEGIDVILTGHNHLVFPGPDYEGFDGLDHEKGTIHGKPAVMAGFWGSHLGLIDLMLERDGDGWRIAGSEVEARPIAEQVDGETEALVESEDDVLDSVAEEHQATLDYIRRAVGKTSAPLYSYFALVADDPSVQIVSNAQIWYVEKLLKGTEWEGLPLLSAAAPFKAGGRGGPEYYTDVAAGDVAIKNVADLYLYPNTVRAVLVTGAQLRDWLERSAGMFRQVTPGSKDTRLINDKFPSFNFDVIDGVTYRIDLSEPSKFNLEGRVVHPEARRIVDLKHDGKPVDPKQKFVVATNNYRASGGGNFAGAGGDTIIVEAPDTNRDVLVRYINEQGTINPSADANWSFKEMPGTTVLFDTGPGGRKYIDDVEGVEIEAAGEGPKGFARYRILL